MDLTTFAKEVYLFFTSRVYSKPSTGFCKTKKSIEAFEHFGQVFTERYGTGAGPEYVWFYVAYQFSKFEIVDFRPKGYVKFVTPVLVFGKKAMEDFGNRTSIDALTKNAEWMRKRKINKQEFVRVTGFTFNADMSRVDYEKVEAKLQQYQDPIKAATVKFQTGPDTCYDLTDLYNDQDASCKVCPYAVDCRDNLKEINPRLYNLRNYE